MPPLILAIEPDRRQASKIAAVARNFLEAELLVTESTEEALGALASRIPDLILTPLFLSPKDESALDDRLRQLDTAGTKVQTLVTPLLAAATARKPSQKTGLLTRLRKKGSAAVPDGCEQSVFAAQITEYLDRALAERRAADEALREGERTAVRTRKVTPGPVEDINVAQDFAAEAPALSTHAEDSDLYVATLPEPPAPMASADEGAFDPTAAMVQERFAAILEPAIRASEPLVVERPAAPETIAEPIAEPVAESVVVAPIANTVEPPLTMRESVLAAFSRRAPEAPPAVPDFTITEAAAVPDFSLVEVDDRSAASVGASDTNPASLPADASEPSTTTGVLHDAALAAEVAAILGATIDEVSPTETAPDGLPLQADEIRLDADGWEEIDLEAMEAMSDAAPSQPAPAGLSEIDDARPATSATFKRPRSGSAAAFMKRIEARLAKKVSRSPAPDVADATPVDEALRNGPLEDEPGPSADDYDPNRDLWMPLTTGARTEWPPLAAVITVPPAAPAPVEADGSPASKRASGGRKKKPAPTAPKPAQDEWGLYDPQQCGFAALLAKLDEVTDTPTE
jgi:hypothetical protein